MIAVVPNGPCALYKREQVNNDSAVPRFGELLRHLRERRKLSQGQVRNYLKNYGVTLSSAAMSRYEHGERAAPDPAVLYGMSKCYGVELEQLVAALVAERANKPLPEIQMIERPGNPSARAMVLAQHFDSLDEPSQLALLHVVNLGHKKPTRTRKRQR
jgi:transcriptional regulator with XRE-family HTH domain